MPNILHIINGEFYAGAERVQDLLALRLPEFGYTAHLACLKPGVFKKNCACAAELVLDFPMRSRADLAQVGNIIDYIKKNNIRLLHSHTPRAALISALVAIRTGLPRVHHIHSPTSRDTENKWRNRVNTLMEKTSVIGVKHFIAVSESLKLWAEGMGTAKKRIIVVPNGVPAQPYKDRAGRTGALVVGSVALFRPRKGLEVLIKALNIVRKNGTNCILHVIGGFETPEYESYIKNLAYELGLREHIVWLGFQQDIPDELSKLDIFALPSLYGEGMPMVILEAMAAGLPVVASDVEGIPQVLGRNNEIGRLVEPGDAGALAQSLGEILVMPEAERFAMGSVARQRHADMYSDSAMAKNVASIYSKILRNN